jgi:SAM-dependent methyltransferase
MAIATHAVADRWNGAEGVLWAQEAERFDRLAEPQVPALLASVVPGERILDVGCGAGAVALAAARAVAPGGHVLAIDVSEPLLEVARRRAAPSESRPDFVLGDAATYAYERSSRDAVVSRSTVMLFDDPVDGLATIRTALVAGGRLSFTCWRGAARNGWASIPGSVVARHLPNPAVVDDARPTRAPGAFALADHEHLRAVVEGAGYIDVHLESLDHAAVVGDDVDDALAFFDRVSGGALRVLAPPHVVDAVEADLRDAVTPYAGQNGVALPASAWLVTATSP